ncbi:MAG: energy transducer TonB [Paracoccaceae bacterium]
MTRGAYISGIGHGGLILWALFGGFFLSGREPLPVQASDVSLISSAEFAALTLPNQPPLVPFEAPQPITPDPEDQAPDISPTSENPPEPPEPTEVSVPEVDTAPTVPDTLAEPETQVEDAPPVIPVPAIQDSTPDLGEPDGPAQPAAAPRVAPVAAAAPEPETEISETTAPEVAPDETVETVAEETPATAPEEAATEIVTEAETPSAAPLMSPRPSARPVRPKVADAASPPVNDPVAEAVAEAVNAATPTPTRPTGPPLTGGEKDVLRIAVQNCWNVGSLSSEALETTVVVAVSMKRDGRPDTASIRLLSHSGGSNNSALQAFEAGRRAIIRCGINGYDLPLEKYSHWQDIEMTFNPEKMRIK